MSIRFKRSGVLQDVRLTPISGLLQALFCMSWRKRQVLASALVVLGLCGPALAADPIAVTQWRSSLIELNQAWFEHDGDQPEWSRPEFDDSAWNIVDLADLGPARQGWHWYRRRVNFGPDQRDLRLLVAGGDGTYELFINGIRVPGPILSSSLLVRRPVEAVFPVSSADGVFVIGLRTRVPPGYAAWHLPQFTRMTMGLPAAIGYERQALESERLLGLAPSICINLLLCLAGVTALALYAIQQTQREYIFLGLYLLLVGISNGLSMLQSAGFLPLSANFLIADPLIYVWVIAQIEFTYSFAGRRDSTGWTTLISSAVRVVSAGQSRGRMAHSPESRSCRFDCSLRPWNSVNLPRLAVIQFSRRTNSNRSDRSSTGRHRDARVFALHSCRDVFPIQPREPRAGTRCSGIGCRARNPAAPRSGCASVSTELRD